MPIDLLKNFLKDHSILRWLERVAGFFVRKCKMRIVRITKKIKRRKSEKDGIYTMEEEFLYEKTVFDFGGVVKIIIGGAVFIAVLVYASTF